MSRILVAEDSSRVSSFLEKGLRAAGHLVTVSDDGVRAAALARDAHFDLLILDLGLPGQDGFEVLRAIRARGERIPVLVLTARHHLQDTIAALDGGADDYLTKPFNFDELLARVRARVRTESVVGGSPSVLEAGGVTLDLHTRLVTVDGEPTELTAKEHLLLETFMRHRGQALSRDQLLSHAWGHDAEVGSNVVDVYVGYLRRKLGAHRFEAMRGFGYRMPA